MLHPELGLEQEPLQGLRLHHQEIRPQGVPVDVQEPYDRAQVAAPADINKHLRESVRCQSSRKGKDPLRIEGIADLKLDGRKSLASLSYQSRLLVQANEMPRGACQDLRSASNVAANLQHSIFWTNELLRRRSVLSDLLADDELRCSFQGVHVPAMTCTGPMPLSSLGRTAFGQTNAALTEAVPRSVWQVAPPPFSRGQGP
mmetsp:Transcript_12052/g.26773  ORF Transcript_12052/g.26773 Transcript_12052/m.26773 type:complete len:201 (-) Transcript_12052:243-845(-)